MSTINLLPWRRHLRQRARKQLRIILVIGFAITILIVVLIHEYVMKILSTQRQQNIQLEAEMVHYSKQLQAIKAIQSLRHSMLINMNFIQSMKMSPSLIAHLFEELSQKIPDSVFLDRLERNADKILVLGYASTNTAISQFLRNLEASNWVHQVALLEIKTRPATAQQHYNFVFTLQFLLKPNPR